MIATAVGCLGDGAFFASSSPFLVSPAEKVRMSKDSESEDIGARREGIRTDRRDLPTAGRRLCCEEKTTRITPVPRFGQEF